MGCEKISKYFFIAFLDTLGDSNVRKFLGSFSDPGPEVGFWGTFRILGVDLISYQNLGALGARFRRMFHLCVVLR